MPSGPCLLSTRPDSSGHRESNRVKPSVYYRDREQTYLKHFFLLGTCNLGRGRSMPSVRTIWLRVANA